MRSPVLASSRLINFRGYDKSWRSSSILLLVISRCGSAHWQFRHLLLLTIFFLVVAHMESALVKRQVGLIRLQHVYADLLATSKKNLVKGLSKELIDLFKAHDKARHGRFLSDVIPFALEGTANPFLAGVDDEFPLVTLHFEGAGMNLKGSQYLIQQEDHVSASVWCIGWQPSTSISGVQLTILGDIVLKNQLVVYDLENQRIGWVDFDCKRSIAVSTSGKSQSMSQQQLANHALRLLMGVQLFFILCEGTTAMDLFS